ncbi:hypothetical protein FJT64_025439 [Amphibalanus amphitrite]|uniref:Reverse transcriptase domain-containing protein n=1 Tax=Amphibalanus amphitrite TaxID=1232801 RepID=A0A6A4WF36_AMPAM|nr:hypothetical protein FJT64_025439 [Amphibalanus amphitrite]
MVPLRSRWFPCEADSVPDRPLVPLAGYDPALAAQLVHGFRYGFPLGSAEVPSACQRSLGGFQAMCRDLAIPLRRDKTVAPCRSLTFLGVVLDLERGELRLPADKLARARAGLTSLLARRKAPLRMVFKELRPSAAATPTSWDWPACGTLSPFTS